MLLRPIVSRICRHQHFAKFCILRNAVSPENEVSPSPPEEKSREKAYVISYLVNSCGLSTENAISASKKVHFNVTDKPNSVLKFLENQGFSETQIADLVRRRPHVLVCNPEKSLLPKFEFLLQITKISEEDVRRIVSTYPYTLTSSLENRLAPAYHYLKDRIGGENVQTLFKRGSWVFHVDPEKRLIPNVDFLMNLGVPKPCIMLSLSHFASMFCLEHDEFKKIVEEVKRMGFDPMKSMFILAINVRAVKRNIALWDQCYEAYSKWGWSKEDIYAAFRKHPNCMLMSEKKISSFMDFLVNKMGRESRLVAECPNVLFYSIKKRVVPRCSIVKLLSSKGLVKTDWSLSGVLCLTEKDFLEKYVTRHMEKLPQLGDIYRKARAVEA